jgi:two-component system sensor histidine kinase CpxA
MQLPRSLFLKIFIWFGAVMVTVIVGTFVAGELMRPERSEPPMRRPLDLRLSAYARDAAEEYERGGREALNAYLDIVQRESNIRAFLFDSQLHELSGRRIPADAPGVAQRAFQTRLPEVVASGGSGPLLARLAVTQAGGQYVLVGEMPPRTPPGVFHPIMHVFAIILVGGLFCYGLAKYLTSPVAKLRAATRELANGNLGVRVGPSLGKRRDELASLGADFDLMAEKIESLINSQRRLLGDISHELRSPLARLNVALELARQRSGGDATSALQRIQRETENLNEMIGQLLALTRLESGAETQEKREFDLSQLTREIVDDADFEARSRQRSVRLETTGACPMFGTEHLLRRAIENVVRNAVQFTAEGSEVEVKLECLDETRAEETGNRVSNTKYKTQGSKLAGSLSEPHSDQGRAVITVRDYGAGVPQNALAEIFRPFYRVDDARDREAGGVGLGLAIADRAVRLHGGRVTAINAPKGGLLVTIILPTSKQQTANSKQPSGIGLVLDGHLNYHGDGD